MNETLTTLINSYLEGGTGAVMLYYDFNQLNTGVSGFAPYTGTILNQSPAKTVGKYPGYVLEATGATSAAASALMPNFLVNNISGGDFGFSNIKFGPLQDDLFLPQSGFDSEVTFLFSFEKKNNQDGILFGSLKTENYSDSSVSFTYGKGFNIGINDRNQLFFQGVDSTQGPYLLTATEIELAKKNICSVRISPYQISFAHFNLAGDIFTEQFLRSDVKIQNNDWTEPFYLGTSPTYYKQGKTLSGYIDEFMMISGSPSSSDLKSISSGFVSSGYYSVNSNTGLSYITGFFIDLIYRTGITGYLPTITGYTVTRTETDLVEFVLVSSTGIKRDGTRFITGYSLPNNSGDYLEETSFLFETDRYTPTGNNAFATLGLVDSGQVVNNYVIQTTKIVEFRTGLPLYTLTPQTGILSIEPSGYTKVFLTGHTNLTGQNMSNLILNSGVADQYKFDYLYFLQER